MIKIQNNKLKFAIVGCGRISSKHFESLMSLKSEIELVAFCEIKKSKIYDIENKYNIRGYSILQDMLENEDLDYVVLCTPSGYHSEQAILAAKYKVNIISEKPMATNMVDANKMIKACKKNRVKLFVVKQNRKNATLQILKKAIDEKRFGKIKMVVVNVFWTRPQSYYNLAPWRGTKKLDGGALMNQASHYADLLTWLIGPVKEVHSYNTRSLKIEAEDTGVINIKWKNGAIGSMNYTMLTYPKNYEGSITILGTNGSASIGGVAVNKILNWEFKDKKFYDKKINKLSYSTKSVYGHGHKSYYKDLLNYLKLGDKTKIVDSIEGLKSLKLITMAINSSEKNRPIKNKT